MRSILVATSIGFMLISGGCAALMEEERADSTSLSATESYNKALSKYQAGQYAEARNMFHEFIGQHPDSMLNKVALYYLGHCYQMLGDKKEASVLYSRVINAYGDDDFWGSQAMKRIQQIKETETQ